MSCMQSTKDLVSAPLVLHVHRPVNITQHCNADKYISHLHISVQVPYDLLVGADGAGSIVRSALQQILPTTFLRRYRHNHMYTSAPIPNPHSEGNPTHTMLEAHALLKVS